MKINSNLKTQITITIGYLAFFFISSKILIYLSALQKTTYNGMPLFNVQQLIPILFGILLGLPSLTSRWNTHNKTNFSKLIIQGIPASIIGVPWVYIFLYFKLNFSWLVMLLKGNTISIIAGVWLGKILVDSIKSVEKEVG